MTLHVFHSQKVERKSNTWGTVEQCIEILGNTFHGTYSWLEIPSFDSWKKILLKIFLDQFF
jgi:hypothetical protein